jgi:hypothetical protein
MKPGEGRMICTFCGACNPDSEEVCPNTGGRHSLVSSSDKQELGQGRGPGPGLQQGTTDPLAHGNQEDKLKASIGARKLDIPGDYQLAYNKGWTSSARSADLERVDKMGAADAVYDGYLDYAAGREKWHTYHCRLNGGCDEHQWARRPQHEAHGFAQTDTVKHCPFCGSGDVWGGSDGTITCEFDGATFQVSVEPEYPSAPGSMNGVPLNIDGEPDAFGQADAGDAMAVPEGVSPSSGVGDQDEGEDEDEGEGGPPWLNGGGNEDEDEEEDEDDEAGQDEGSGAPFRTSSYRTFAGDVLPEDLYLKHLAIRHAEEPRRFLASLRSGR